MTKLARFVLPFIAAVLLFPSLRIANASQLQVLQKEGVGSYLATAQGLPLYYNANDKPGKPTCFGPCLETWPAVADKELEPPQDLNPKDFGYLTRPDGFRQATFRGYPLYTYFQDTTFGDVKGEGIDGVWHTINPTFFPPPEQR